MKSANWRNVFAFVLSLLLLFSGETQARDIAPQYEIHGFVAQGVMQAEDSNFINDDGDVSFQLTEIGVNGIWKFKPSLSLAGQVTYLNADSRYKEGGRLDYLFLKWTAFTNSQWNIDFSIGRYKNQHWLYSATSDVPMTRPTIMLPQSVYFDGSRDISLGSDGVSLQANYFSNLGELELNWSYGSSPISDDQVRSFISDSVKGNGDQEYAHQLSLYWQPELSNFRWGLSYLDSEFEYTAQKQEFFSDAGLLTKRYFGSLYFSGEFWEFSSEIFLDKSEIVGLFSPDFYNKLYGLGGYFQLRYHLDSDWIITIRQDKFFRNKDDKGGDDLEESSGIPKHFGFQHDLTLGLSYDFAEDWRVMAEVHMVEGTARTLPSIIPEVELNKEKYWQIWALQVMYWF